MVNFSDPLDALASLDLIDPIEGWLSGFAFADWAGAIKRHGPLGLVREFVSAATANNSPVIAWKRHSGWPGPKVEALLKRHGVVVYGRGFTKDTLLCKVKARQSRWATYMLKRAGVPVVIGYWVPKDATWESQPRSAEPPVPVRYRKR